MKLKLFEGGDECPPVGERLYGTTFSAAATRYIWWEVEVICLPPEEDLPFDLTFFYYDEKGNVLGGKATTIPCVTRRARRYGFIGGAGAMSTLETGALVNTESRCTPTNTNSHQRNLCCPDFIL